VAHAGGDMCHADINMVMWQHQRLPRVTHFWIFRVDLWTNEKVPRGSPYSHVADHMVMWQDEVAAEVEDCDMAGDCTGGWCGPMVGCHMAQSWAATWQWENAQ
jgi:hypothetical protein